MPFNTALESIFSWSRVEIPAAKRVAQHYLVDCAERPTHGVALGVEAEDRDLRRAKALRKQWDLMERCYAPLCSMLRAVSRASASLRSSICNCCLGSAVPAMASSYPAEPEIPAPASA